MCNSAFMAGDEASVEAEYIRWQQLWRQTDLSKRPKTVVEALQSANEFGTYPSIQTLLHIFATLPVTTSTTERSFSALKYIIKKLSTFYHEREPPEWTCSFIYQQGYFT